MRRNVCVSAFSVAVALASACAGSPKSFGTDDGGSTDNLADGAAATGTSSSTDAGTACGTQTCAASEVCCYGTGMTPSCMASGSCQGSFLACSSQSACGSGTCCFTYGQANGEEAAAPTGLAGLLAAPGGPFTAQCQDSCAMTSYRLCASDSECQAGETCGMGPYAHYCQVNPFGDGGFLMPPSAMMTDQ